MKTILKDFIEMKTKEKFIEVDAEDFREMVAEIFELRRSNVKKQEQIQEMVEALKVLLREPDQTKINWTKYNCLLDQVLSCKGASDSIGENKSRH